MGYKKWMYRWIIWTYNHFTYDISGQSIVLDEEEIKEKNENKRKYVNSSSSSGKYNKPITPKRFDYNYDIESNSNDSYTRVFKKLNKNEIIDDVTQRENERLNQNKQLFVKEKIANCLEKSQDTIKKINDFSKCSTLNENVLWWKYTFFYRMKKYLFLCNKYVYIFYFKS